MGDAQGLVEGLITPAYSIWSRPNLCVSKEPDMASAGWELPPPHKLYAQLNESFQELWLRLQALTEESRTAVLSGVP